MLDDYERAIQHSVSATSKGNSHEDAVIERALRASLKELQNADQEGGEHNDEAYQSAINASMQEYKKAHEEHGQETGVVSTDRDDELERVLTQSLKEYKGQPGGKPPTLPPRNEHAWADDSDSGLDTDYDESFERAVEESKQLHTQNEEKKRELAEREAALGDNGHGVPSQANDSSHINLDDDSDEELKKAITASSEHEQQRQKEFSKQKTEEEVVLEYVKKQSLLEEQMKKQRDAKNDSVATS